MAATKEQRRQNVMEITWEDWNPCAEGETYKAVVLRESVIPVQKSKREHDEVGRPLDTDPEASQEGH